MLNYRIAKLIAEKTGKKTSDIQDGMSFLTPNHMRALRFLALESPGYVMDTRKMGHEKTRLDMAIEALLNRL